MGIVSVGNPGEPTHRRKGKKGRGKWLRKKPEIEAKEEALDKYPPKAKSVKLTVPGTVFTVEPSTDAAVDPHEPRYCYCNQVSFGEVCFV